MPIRKRSVVFHLCLQDNMCSVCTHYVHLVHAITVIDACLVFPAYVMVGILCHHIMTGLL